MFDQVTDWLLQNKPSIFICLLLISITWYVANRYNHWVERIKKAEKECDKIDGNITPQLEQINKSLTQMTGTFNTLIMYLKTKDKDGKMDIPFFVSKSPIQLSDLGLKILNDVGGKNFIDNNLSFLFKQMEAKGVYSALDAQTIAPIVINDNSNLISFKPIKDFAYKNPFYKFKIDDQEEVRIPLDLTSIVSIMGVYLRNCYLERHPALDPLAEVLS